VTLLLDAGSLIALDRDDRAMWVRLKMAREASQPPVTHAGVLGQAWRGGPRQARLSRALDGVEVRPLDEPLGRGAGELLGGTHGADVIDAALVLLANDGDQIATSDPDDLAELAAVSGRHVELIQV